MGFERQVLGERPKVSVGRSREQEMLPDCERGCSRRGSAAVLGTCANLYQNRILLAGRFMHVPDSELIERLKQANCQHDTPNTTISGVEDLSLMRRSAPTEYIIRG